MYYAQLSLVILFILLSIIFYNSGDYKFTVIYSLIGIVNIWILMNNEAYIKMLISDSVN